MGASMAFSLRLTGLIAAPHSPMKPDGSLNPDIVSTQAKLLGESGVKGAFICGTTGESSSLTVAERRTLAERWMECAKEKLQVIVHIGHNSLPDAQALARHAGEIGANAIAVVAPSYFRPAKLDDLIDFCAAVASAAPQTPLYYYDIPSMTNLPIATAEFLRKGRERIPNLHGIKFTNTDLMTLQECLSLDGFDIVFGFDEMLLAGLALGIRGAVGSTYNFAAPLYRRVIDAFERGDWDTARKAQRQSVTLIRTLQEFGFSRASKAIMRLLGVDCGPPRLPLQPMSEAELGDLYRKLRPLDIFARPLQDPA
jgi:N-acetylneuraminate lyase